MNPQSLGQRIAQARREMAAREHRDVTRTELAEAAGVEASAVTQWEKDQKIPREEALSKLALYLGVTPAYLRYGVHERSRSPLAAAEDVGLSPSEFLKQQAKTAAEKGSRRKRGKAS